MKSVGKLEYFVTIKLYNLRIQFYNSMYKIDLVAKNCKPVSQYAAHNHNMARCIVFMHIAKM